MMVNRISNKPVNHALTGGFGLANLESLIESEGGRMSFSSTGRQWIINAVIPKRQEKSDIKGEDRRDNTSVAC